MRDEGRRNLLFYANRCCKHNVTTFAVFAIASVTLAPSQTHNWMHTAIICGLKNQWKSDIGEPSVGKFPKYASTPSQTQLMMQFHLNRIQLHRTQDSPDSDSIVNRFFFLRFHHVLTVTINCITRLCAIAILRCVGRSFPSLLSAVGSHSHTLYSIVSSIK